MNKYVVTGFNEATAISCGDLRDSRMFRYLNNNASTRPQRLAVEIIRYPVPP